MKRGATLWIPKALRFDRLVAGQIPTGWNAKHYGIPDDIIDQVDPRTGAFDEHKVMLVG